MGGSAKAASCTRRRGGGGEGSLTDLDDACSAGSCSIADLKKQSAAAVSCHKISLTVIS